MKIMEFIDTLANCEILPAIILYLMICTLMIISLCEEKHKH